MEAECEVAAHFGDTVKEPPGTSEVPEALPAECIEGDSSILAQTNGMHLDENIPYEPSDIAMEENNALTDEVITSQVIHDDVEQQEPTEVEEAGKVEPLVQAIGERESSTEIKDNLNIKVDIETVREEVTEGNSFETSDMIPIESGDGNDFDMEFHVIRDQAPSQSELRVLAEATGDRHATDLLTQMQQHTEFSDVLHAPASADSGDNNNMEKQEQVLNKKELLDILEGNEPEGEASPSADNGQFSEPSVTSEYLHNIANNEDNVLLAIQQLSGLSKRRRIRPPGGSPHTKSNKRKVKNSRTTRSNSSQKTPDVSVDTESTEMSVQPCEANKAEVEKDSDQTKKSKDLIKILVEDWDDDEIPKEQQEQTKAEDITDAVSDSQLDVADKSDTTKQSDQTSTETPSEKSFPPQRRMSRVIKKKVIFDPDNPDTFTCKKSPNVKSKPESIEREEPLSKKNKTEVSIQKTKEKLPTSKSKAAPQWKKPPPKNNKHNKRLTEVDKLLMDEGAVNMMYQLNTSGEADPPKGKKNIRSKAAFIKKFGLTPESNEIKFRERRKEPAKTDEVSAGSVRRDARLRTSTNNSVASPAQCDTYETHSADDSIIIRRHSSSSYSSSCLSPRRLSDLDVPATASAPPPTTSDNFNDVFMSSATETDKTTEVLDKKDCLSLKEKLNSKLSRVLNFKRKREGKYDRSESKQKKLKEKKNGETESNVAPNFNKVTVSFDARVAEINILKEESGSNVYDLETLKELKQALEYVDRQEEVSVTLLLSQSGNLCGGLDLQSIHTADKKIKAANEVANAARALFVCMEQHNKFVCAGVEGACVGMGVGLLALCDVVVASDRATFCLLAGDGAIVPGTAVLTSHRKSLLRSLVTEMLVFGRQLTATEALSRGLVSRTLWPDRFNAELRAMVRDIASHQPQALQLKKRLLGLRNNVEPKSAFLSCLDTERDLLVAYWTSAANTAQ